MIQKKKKDSRQISYPKNGKDFGMWYQEVLLKGSLIEYTDVKGCYVFRPRTMHMWNAIRKMVENEIVQKLDVQETYFPLFATKQQLEKEENHLEGFAPEVAWIQHEKEENAVAVRPTSETIMYPIYKKWIRSHRDLPLKCFQWANIVRWEMSHCMPFVRSREFLWHEGHTVFELQQEAEDEVDHIIKFYEQIYEELLAVPVFRGTKTAYERFAGAEYTKTVEAYIPEVGRAIQGGTSHFLGQNFSKMFELEFLDDNNRKTVPFQNSWGLTPRALGTMIMIHSDEQGLVLPPKISPTEIIVIPLHFKNSDIQALNDAAENMYQMLKSNGFRVLKDMRQDKTPGYKFSEAELLGIPLRIEIGPKDLENNTLRLKPRIKDIEPVTESIPSVETQELFIQKIRTTLDSIQQQLLKNAQANLERSYEVIDNGDMEKLVDVIHKNKKVALVPFCNTEACESSLKNNFKSIAVQYAEDEEEIAAPKSLCVPDFAKTPSDGTTCINCKEKATTYTLFGYSY